MRNKRPGLTRRVLVETALRLLDETGLEGLTVRRLAAELGVQSPALYWHIRTKQELLDEMADAIIQAAGMGPPREGETWQDWLCRRATAYRASLLAHRDGARIVATARRLSPETVELFEAELAAMTSHGFTPAVALRTITTVTYYVNGFVLQEQSQPEPQDRPHPEPPSPPGLPDPAAMPTLLAAVHQGGNPLGDQAFAHGLQTLIRGTETSMTGTTR
ncbi:TetR family transcriptional regulator [Sphaerisporangium krabiense]|uniref:TetR/AcrR family tetracycline transcriptional repressor n=1 Tax=Sphaerisporangium krabiense TaxID=763782 RepID=A0A7W9DR29_9ACTN|nr:TetR/AcrR family transcriptional regulator C-terminal domain-containing protein [Sphaerisporangium krabiense]MBB5628116.1 TetR/AcrR family tetracycline transcriptional repressor [Sphaerisporangium krabiense]GII62283.1 TetR family transcriptional regulator [Sphaerisporangium krabiense]